jgi:1-acyl-sn-glycerol-3-phosphate acyltransferase
MPALAVVNVELYQRSAAGFMFVAAPVGFGMLIAAFILGVCNPRFGSEVLITLGLVLCGVFIGLQMIVPVFGVGVGIALMTGIGAGVLLVPLNTMLQRCTADHIRGRVFAAKEIIQEFGQVVISGVIWQAGAKADPWMRPAAGAMALGLIALAVWGLMVFVLRGPGTTRGMNLTWRLVRMYCEIVHRLEARGREHVPRQGAVLLVSNHTSGLDPALIQSSVARPVCWMMAREYMIGPLGWLWRIITPIGVRRGRPDPAAARQAIERLKAGQVVGIFPEGRINRAVDDLLQFNAGLAMIARRGGATIVPVYISGSPRGGHPLGAYLRPSRSRVRFGEPIDLSEIAETDEAAAAYVRDQIRGLGGFV